MKSLFPIGLLLLVSIGHAQIPVTPGGIQPVTFDTWPTQANWAAYSLAGASSSFSSVAAVDTAVIGTSVASFTSRLLSSSGVSTHTLSTWHSTGQRVYTGPAGVAIQMLMATLRNDTGSDLHALPISYYFQIGNFVGPEEVPGQRVFFSLSGTANSWQLVPALSGNTNAGWRSAVLDLGTWPPGANLYLLWAQDNAARSPDTCYTIDNFSTGIIDDFPIMFIGRSGASNIVVSWTGTGTLQWANALAPSPAATQWFDIPGATSGFVTNVADGPFFFRIRP